MKNKRQIGTDKKSLRDKAAKELKLKNFNKSVSLNDPKALVHELQVHQIELEVQNEQLRHTLETLEEVKQKYYELYNFAPAGYFVFNAKGKIIDVNLTGCNLLGDERRNILDRQFQIFLAPGCRNEFNQFCSSIIKSGEKQQCELILHREKNENVYLLLVGKITDENENIKVTATDITDRKLIEIEHYRANDELEKLKNNLEQLVRERTHNLENVNREILLLAQAISSTIESVCITDSKKRILFVNIAFVHTYGYDAKKILGKSIELLCANESDANRCSEIFRNAVEQNWKGEFLHRKKNGDIFPAEVSISPLKNDEGEITAFIVLTSDITDRKKAEEEILKSHREQQLIFQSVPVVLYNAVSGSDYDASWISENVQRITGFTANQFITQPNFWRERIHSDDRERVLKEFKSICESKIINTEYRWLCADNTYRWFMEKAILIDQQDGNQKIIYGAWVDITDRKLVAEAVERSEKHFRSLIENSSDIIVLINCEGIIVYASPSTERVMGYQFEEVIGIDIFKLVHPEDLQKAREIFSQSLKHPKLVIHMDIRALHKNGAWRWVKCSGVNLLLDTNVSGIVLNISDITVRKWAEEQLIDTHKDLQATTQAIPDLLFRIDRKGTFLDYHAGSDDLLYVKPHEFIGKNVSDVLPPEVAKLIYHAIDVVLEKKEIFTFEYQLTMHGEPKEYEARTVFKDEDEVIFFVRDITDRKIALEAIKTSERKYRDIFIYAPVGIYQSTKDGKFITANLRLAQTLGYDSIDEIIKLDIGEDIFYNKGERELLIAKHESTGTIVDLEIVWRKKNGSPIWIALTVHAVKNTIDQTQYYEGFVRDITVRKLAEKEISQSKNKYQQLIDNISDAIIVDDIEGRVTYANQNFFNLFGIPEKNSGKIVLEDYVAPEWRAQLRDRHNRRIAGEDVPSHFEYEGIRGDGNRLWVEVSVVKIMDDEKIIGTQSSLGNITERKIAEQTLRNFTRKIIEVQENERGRVTRELHDSVIQLMSAAKLKLAVVDEKILHETGGTWIELTLSENLIEKAIREIRNISRGLKPSILEDLGLVPAVRSLCEEVHSRTDINIGFESSKSYFRLDHDVELTLYRIIQEALNNIEKHSGATNAEVMLFFKEKLISAVVRDNGVGFDNTSLIKDASSAGYGLVGMRERAESVGGVFEIHSIIGRGTEIVVKIPCEEK
ncbi:MAG: hypothetical protein C0417_07110 [Chlorobiaceae bacterium]|nr:hypothetical protein [Chlorobiaceae bacterium]